MSEPQRKPRKYRRITPDVKMRFEAERALQGNGSAAVRVLEPDSLDPASRAYEIASKPDNMTGAAYLDSALDQIAKPAIDRVASVIQSADDQVALRASMFVVDHVRGKAVQRTENKNLNLTIEAVLD